MAEETREVTSITFSTYGRPLKMVTYLKYLGIWLSAAYDDWLAVFRNLVKARMVWRRMLRIQIREGEIPQVSVFFSEAVVQLVLLFGAEIGWLPPAWDGP